TPSGKVDRIALPTPEVRSQALYVAPRNPIETTLTGIWSEVLGRDRVGIHDDFFALGGHSLLATRLASRLRSALGIVVPVAWIFEAPTIAQLAQRVDLSRRPETLPPQ